MISVSYLAPPVSEWYAGCVDFHSPDTLKMMAES
jgi:hypothetical protein